uniref:ribosomal protein L23 n=1 Tax=Xylanche himalaica TaxID=315440 RepID=UPI00226D0B16|nr:ribosomal protein L23 [Xylanche himalaica]YP_010575703.1 ribosomal protein L23 [Xylanche himalaica]UZN42926.1 ribosomal protein L23 [Xylanche himalaica]UZN42936.1 ribosomal protein L23 [Xylanche himalaica]
MDGIKNAVFTDKSIRLLGKNQYTSNVESGSTRTELKHWVELFFGVKVIDMNSHRLPGRERVEEWDLLWDIQCITDV